MKLNVQPVVYVVAVSGGVDSVVLLDILARWFREPSAERISRGVNRQHVRLVVAHLDHGMREDSAHDRKFVGSRAQHYGLPFKFEEVQLGGGTSEATAREARYAFLRHIKQTEGAQAIVTAHHEDDVFETAVINLLRGTGRKGLSSLAATDEIYRPLLATPKAHILAYAHANKLQWHEDSTNKDDDYLRNYVRHHIMSRFDAEARSRLRQLIANTRGVNIQIDEMLAHQLHLQPSHESLDRQWFIMLPHSVAVEIIAAWFRSRDGISFDRKLLERIVIAAKRYAPGKLIDIDKWHILLVEREKLVLTKRAMIL